MNQKLAKTAFRNISRNKRRSILSGTAIAVAAMSIVILFAFIGGMSADMSENLRSFYTGDIRIRNKDFAEFERYNPIHLTVNVDDVKDILNADSDIQAWTPRTTFPAAFNGSNFGAVGVGVDLEREKDYLNINSIVHEGRLPEYGKNEMIIGAVLARDMKLKIGDKVTLMTTTAARGTNAITLKVTGIATFPVATMNAKYFWMPLDRAQYFLRMPHNSLDIIIKLKDGIDPKKKTAELIQQYKSNGMDFEISPLLEMNDMYGFLKLAENVYNIMAFIFFLLGSTVIINTTMMVIFERMREIGTMSAMGMHGNELIRLFFLEGTFISAIGSAVGVLLGVVVTLYLKKVGIDFTDAMSGMDFEISSVLYPVLSIPKTIFVYFYAVVIAALATFIPSRKAARIEPVEALRYI